MIRCFLFLLMILSSSLQAEKTKIVFIAGNDSHGPLAHEHTRGNRLLASLLKEAREDIETVNVTGGFPKDLSVFENAKAVVVYCDGGGGHILNRNLDVFDKLMARGVGLLQIHYAVETKKGKEGNKFLEWMGGYFERFWSVNPIWTPEFKQIPNHPVSNGVKPFSMTDEWYFHMRFQPKMDGVVPILSAVPPASTMKRKDGPHSGNPTVREEVKKGLQQHVAWAYQRPGGGRGAGITGGHYHKSWQNDNFRKVAMNAICWIAGLEIPENGIETRTPTDKEIASRTAFLDKEIVEKLKKIEVIYQSPIVNKKNSEVKIEVDIKGRSTIVLAVSDEGASIQDHALWLNPRLSGPLGEIKLTEKNWKSIQNSGPGTQINKCCCNKPISLRGHEKTNGIGTHAISVIEYDVPAGYEKFIATGALNSDVSRGEVKFALLGEKVDKSDIYALMELHSSLKSSSLIKDRITPVPNESPEQESPAEQKRFTHVPEHLFTLPVGLEVKLWAKSPLFYNPTNIDVDLNGRIWVTEGRRYRGRAGTLKEGDRVVVLEDKDNDGVADSSHVFVQDPELLAPMGIAVVDNKIIVSNTPDLIVYTDVNRNLVFDEGDTRETLLRGFHGKNHDHSLHSVTVGPNGQFYFNHGNKGSHLKDKEGWELKAGSFYSNSGMSGKKSSDGQVYIGGVGLRINQDGTGLRPYGHNFRNSYEQTVTSFGDIFQNDNDDPPACRNTWVMEYGNLGYASSNGTRKWSIDRVDGQESKIAEWRQEDPGVIPAGDVYGGGSPTGIVYYENGIMENTLSGALISCEPGRNTLFSYFPKTVGAGFSLERNIFLTSNKERDFAGSDFIFRKKGNAKTLKALFRPSDVVVGADGALYVADWFDPRVGGHQSHDNEHAGAIYRIAPKGFKSNIPDYNRSSVKGLIEILKSPSVNVREIGRAGLVAMGEKAIPEVKELLNHPNKYVQARAIWLLSQLGMEGIKTVENLLKSKDDSIRIVAFRALRFTNHDVLRHAANLARDESPAVRREVALSLRYIDFSQCKEILLDLASRFDGDDRWYVEAFGIASTGKEPRVYEMISKNLKKSSWDKVYGYLVWRLKTPNSINEMKSWVFSEEVPKKDKRALLFSLSLIPDRRAVTAMVDIALKGPNDMKRLAGDFIKRRNDGIWKQFDAMAVLSGKPTPPKVYENALVPAPKNSNELPSVKEIVKLSGDLKKGKSLIALCTMCHRINERGVEFGPTLDEWGKGQPLETIIEAIINPSSDLAHGFEGYEIKTKCGKTIQGFIEAEGEVVLVKVFGGSTVSIDSKDIVSRQKLKKSYMIPASGLGMSAQDVRDVAEYLKNN